MNDATDFDLNRHISALADRSTRTYNASAVAQSIGLRALIFLLRDRELDVHRPAPGFPQTLPGGPTWSELLSKCASAGEFKTTVAYPDAQHFEPAHVWVGTDSTVLLFIGGEPRVPASRFAEASHLLIALLHSEAREDAATAAAQRAGDVTRRTTALASALEQARAQVAGNARSLRDALAEAARLNNELRLMNATLEQRVAEEAAERDRIWQTSQDLLAVVDGNGVFKAANPAWTAMLGWSPDEVIGQNHLLFSHPDDVNRSEVALDQALEAPLLAYENRCRHKDGSFLWVSWVASVENGLVYAAGRNIQAEKDAAEQLGVAQEALRQSQKMEAVGQLTGGIAHDFNNLLAGISGSLELISMRLAQGRTAEVERYVTAAQGATRRAASLTHRLLAFSRRQTLAPQPTDVKRLVAGMSDLISRTVGPQVRVETVNGVGLWPSLIDPSQLENAILNLCINARDAMPDGGKITIETANRWLDPRMAQDRGLDPGQYISLCVSDTGVGMTPDIIAKAFDPFFTTKPIGVGTGLGLSMIYGFAKQSGGAVSIYSEPGSGTNVCIYLPRHVGEAEPAGPPAGRAAAPRGDGETVLVVDDEPSVRMLVSEVLADLGYMAIEAEDGASGLRALEGTTRVDLLVTDVGLPGGMNGRQLADAARVARPDLRVLFITGYAENAVLSHGHLDPGMHVMTKPFAMDALAIRIRELITTSPS